MSTLPNTHLSIYEINTNSIISHQKRQYLNSFIKEHNPDVMLLNETHLKNTHNVNITNYDFIRNDRSSTLDVGTGIIIKSVIHYEIVETSQWQLASIECTAILIHTINHRLCIISAYRNARKPALLFADIEKVSDVCILNNWTLVIGGDFNAHHPSWNDSKTCTQGRALAQWMIDNTIQRNLVIESPILPTFRRGTHSSVIDFFIVCATLKISRDTYINHLDTVDYDSDHQAIKLTIELHCRLKKQSQRSVFNYAGADWSHFKNQLDANIAQVHIPSNRNLTPAEIDAKLLEINAAITCSMTESIPKKSLQTGNIKNLPTDILDLINNKKSMRRRWSRIRFRADGPQLQAEIRLLTKIIDDRIRIFCSNSWTTTLKNIKPNPQAFKKVKSLCSLNRMHVPKEIIDPADGSRKSRTTDIANILSSNFEKVHLQNYTLGDPAFTSEVNNYVARKFGQLTPRTIFDQFASAEPSPFNHNQHLISTNSLTAMIKNLPNKKSSGNDQIPNAIIKKLTQRTIVKLATVFNQIYNIGYFPLIWKNAIVIPIAKKNKPTNQATSYRPISLLPCLSKLFERAVKETLDRHCEDHSIFPDDQFGFRQNRSTNQALIILKNDIMNNFNKRTPTIACSTDIEKAFDTVWHEGIIYKMHTTFGFNDHICRCVFNLLRGRSFQVKVENTLSAAKNIAAGVPQGGVMSATLYIIYIADMPTPTNHHHPIQRLQFADDMISYVSVKNLADGQARLNSYLAIIADYLMKWKIRINPTKSELVVFKGHNKHFSKQININSKHVTIQIQTTLLKPQKSLKYLGVIFQQNAKHIRHIDNILHKLRCASHGLKALLSNTNGLNAKIKMLCYKQLLRPLMTYGFPSWSDISSHQMERLRTAERTCIRACSETTRVNARYINNTDLYNKAGIQRIDRVLVSSAIKFFEKNHDECEIFQKCINIEPAYTTEQRNPYKPPWHLMNLNMQNSLYNNEQLILYHEPCNPARNMVYNQNQ